MDVNILPACMLVQLPAWCVEVRTGCSIPVVVNHYVGMESLCPLEEEPSLQLSFLPS